MIRSKWKNSSLIVKEMIFGIFVFDILLEIMILLFTNDKMYYSIGILVGIVLAIGMVLHMYSALETALELGEKGSVAYIRKSYGLRTAVVVAIMALLYFFQIGSVAACFIAVLGLKAAAYMQPFTNKYLSKKILDKGR